LAGSANPLGCDNNNKQRHHCAMFVVLNCVFSISEEEALMAEVEPVWFARSADTNALAAPSPARDRLRAAIAALALAQRDLEDATTPVRRLDAVLAAAERLRLAAAERDAALHAVTVEAATFAAGELTEALNRALTVEAKILSLREALSAQTNGLAAAEKINAALRHAKAAAGVPRNADI